MPLHHSRSTKSCINYAVALIVKTLGSVDTAEIVRPMCLQAIAAQPQNAGLWAARAQTHIKLEDWVSAAEDAGKAVQIDHSNAKAQLRKGCAPSEHARVCTGCIHACMHALSTQTWQLQRACSCFYMPNCTSSQT